MVIATEQGNVANQLIVDKTLLNQLYTSDDPNL